jgi:tetrahydromethanopterin S-methyltransferase subunit G
MEPSRGQAIASVAKAVVVAYEAAALSERLDALETKVNESAAGTVGPGRAA